MIVLCVDTVWWRWQRLRYTPVSCWSSLRGDCCFFLHKDS